MNLIKNLILLGCGTSYFAGMCGKKYFKDLCIFNTIQVIDGAEFELNDIPKKGKTALVLLSQSGETKDLHRCLEMCKVTDVITIGVVNVVDSLIAREVDCGCYLNAGREVAVASTKSFTSQTIILSMIAIWFAQNKDINLTGTHNVSDYSAAFQGLSSFGDGGSGATISIESFEGATNLSNMLFGTKLTTANIDQILNQWVNTISTATGLPMANFTTDLGGSIPSAQGLLDIATLQGRGWTINNIGA